MTEFQSLLNKIHLSTVPQFLEKIPDNAIGLTMTSPPYYDTQLYILDNGKNEFGWGSYDEYLEHLSEVTKELFRITIPGGRLVFVLTNTPQTDEKDNVINYWPITHDLISRCSKQGWIMIDEAIWVKEEPTYSYITDPGIPESQLIPHHDTITVLRKPGQRRTTSDVKKEKSIWRFPKAGPIHSYNKWYPSFPSGLVRKVINLWSYPNDIILDPYAGSGQVVRVALQMERFAIGVEIDEQWKKLWSDIND